jgi:D-aminopeptidase
VFVRLAAPLLALLCLAHVAAAQEATGDDRPRARVIGVAPGVLPPGPLNAITDVAGVEVGHVTLRRADSVRTGVTAIRPHGGNLYQEKVPAGVAVGNGYGKLTGTTQIRELGEIETPVVLTNTLSVPAAMAGVIDWALSYPGNDGVRSVNAVVGETNDGYLNAIRARVVEPRHAARAIEKADGDLPAEGAVGAGTGTVAFGWKGGIGTSSRALPDDLGGYTVGALVQSNYGGLLRVLGVPVGEALGQYYLKGAVEGAEEKDSNGPDDPAGSVMVIVATDAPLSDRNLERLASRALLGIGRTGSPSTNGSGDYVVAFSTAEAVRRTPERTDEGLATRRVLPNSEMSPLFQAVIEATEEAVYNSLFRATTTDGDKGSVEALPVEHVLEVLRQHERLE